MWRWVKVSKSIALLAFFLPWLTVSCSNQKIAQPSGLSLFTGHLSVSNPMTGAVEAVIGPPNFMIIFAATLIAIGLVFAFQSRDNKAAPVVVIGTSLGGMLLVVVSTVTIDGASIADAVSERNGGAASQFARAIIQVEYAYGFWAIVASLAFSAIIAAWLIGEDGPDTGAVGEEFDPATLKPQSAHADLAYWDSIPDKNEPDAMQEYLIRYPSGRFAELARLKLSRSGIEPLTPVPPASPVAQSAVPELQPGVLSRTCPACGRRYRGEANTCVIDGSALA